MATLVLIEFICVVLHWFQYLAQRYRLNMAQNGTYPSTDQAVYEEYARKWADQPQDADGWIKRAQDVASVLEKDASARERENKSPRAEVALLKHSGLTKVLGPKKYGGGDQPWSVGYKTIREVAKADGSVRNVSGVSTIRQSAANTDFQYSVPLGCFWDTISSGAPRRMLLEARSKQIACRSSYSPTTTSSEER